MSHQIATIITSFQSEATCFSSSCSDAPERDHQGLSDLQQLGEKTGAAVESRRGDQLAEGESDRIDLLAAHSVVMLGIILLFALVSIATEFHGKFLDSLEGMNSIRLLHTFAGL